MGEPSYAADVQPKQFVKGVEFKSPITLPPVVNSQIRASAEVEYVLDIADAATTTYPIVVEDGFEVTDVLCQKRGGAGGAANTVQVKKAAAAISDAISINIADTTLARAATIDDAQSVLAAGDTLNVTVTKAGGNAAVLVKVKGVRR